ncbi:cysteine desulfurase NifS [Candidatus Kaiserbacteria bacterium CG10_big_fil_rev_8_21_14_0_10_49_17]|uniref:Cysteine desulfurase NifS n=1 Tax=Candidatus Kaiserbacteria bacterium CG10_big_fil_rev_8_21_14_0_10_49_17 TaxID=1974609 RepID=A0A2M6WFC7_9BACT|nr:MAG: cysteine desulfurase NifS [Candidatus Kaiserbacteria bacterium CG10_big_fil_rev_8_21_14_0_10_49_17]
MFTRGRRVYLDTAASTPVDADVYAAMKPYFSAHYGNPSSIHAEGRAAKAGLEDARSRCAEALAVKASEILFTGGGTEANNIALLGAVRALLDAGEKMDTIHVISTAIEHPSVKGVCEELKQQGASVTYVPVDSEGVVSVEAVRESLTKETKLVSIGYVNSEVGIVQNIRDIGRCIRGYEKEHGTKILFHTDASQAPLWENVLPHHLRIDLMTLDAKMLYGPKGAGLLYVAHGTRLVPVLFGGSQENGIRAGTENVALCVGLSCALKNAVAGRAEQSARVQTIRDTFITALREKIPSAQLNGSRTRRVANNINITIPGIDHEYLAVWLDKEGIAVSTKSACLGVRGSASYVLEELGLSQRESGAIRMTLGKETTQKDMAYTLKALVRFMQKFDRGN